MNENQILYVGTFMCIVLIIFFFKYKKQFAIINAIVFGTYSLILYYGLFFKGEEGKSLGWFILLVISTATQLLVLNVYLIVIFYRWLKRKF